MLPDFDCSFQLRRLNANLRASWDVLAWKALTQKVGERGVVHLLESDDDFDDSSSSESLQLSLELDESSSNDPLSSHRST